jgi:ribonuclease-3
MTDTKRFARLEKRLGYVFVSKPLLVQALTHSSHAYERSGKLEGDNEVLEFLGDSVIGLLAAEYLHGQYPESREGELSKLRSMATSTESLADYARKIKLDKHLLLGKGEELSGGRKKKTILADTFEALVGALFKDGGLEAARALLAPLFTATFKRIKSGGFLINNYKSALQEYFQKQNLPLPVYRIVDATGPDHERVFLMEVTSGGKVLARAKGASKKDAEQKAAQKALRGVMGRRLRDMPCEMFVVKKG